MSEPTMKSFFGLIIQENLLTYFTIKLYFYHFSSVFRFNIYYEVTYLVIATNFRLFERPIQI